MHTKHPNSTNTYSESTANSIYFDVVLPVKHGVFTYENNPETDTPDVGYTVYVPFGKKIYSGIVVLVHHNRPDFKTRKIVSVAKKNPTVRIEQIKFWNWIAAYYLCSIGEVSDAALPSILKFKSEARLVLSHDYLLLIKNDYHKTAVDYLLDNKRATIKQLIALYCNNPYDIILQMLACGLLKFESEDEKYKPLLEKRYYADLSFYDVYQKELTRAHKQRLVIDFLMSNRGKKFSVSEISSHTGISSATVKAALMTQYVVEEKNEISRLDQRDRQAKKNTILSDYQQSAYLQITNLLKEKRPVLLQGVTGSGKTEIYIKLIADKLEQNLQVLYLLPEITLSSHIISRLKHYFGNKVAIYHSRISQTQRAEIWHSVLNNDTIRVVIGTRSAIFLPFKNLGLIIVDEEHDPGYKQQDPAPRYNARDAAIVLSQMTQCQILLGSATPSLETIRNTQQNKYGHVTMELRYGNSPIPKIEVVDYRKWYRRHQVKGHLTPILEDAINRAFDKGEQVILLQNRRGFAPFTQCLSCGYIPRCKNCDISLTIHKKQSKLVCHYCGFSTTIFDNCPECNSGALKNRGFGTEQVEEELKVIFPDKVIARLDSDTASSLNATEQTLSDFTNKKIDLLIGTQMVSKGLDFGGVNLVGVLNADNILSFPDFRSHERGYQLLMQFAGRAGRREQQGRVIIQSSQPNHPVIEALSDNKIDSFTDMLLNERQLFNYPPYSRIIVISIKHPNGDKTVRASKILMKMLKKTGVADVLGPYSPPVAKVNKMFFSLIMIKLNKDEKLMNYRSKVISCIESVNKIEGLSSVSIAADVDPY